MLGSCCRGLLARARSALPAICSRSGPDTCARELYRHAVATLAPRQREIFLLHRVDELSIAEIALRLDMPPRAVEREFAEALLAITRTIDPPP
jgi:DNA-directed RNA polymerase specialized sigma24 family protein